MERALIAQYEDDMTEIRRIVRPDIMETAVALAELPLQIRGFGPVKAENAGKAAQRRADLLAQFRATEPVRSAAE